MTGRNARSRIMAKEIDNNHIFVRSMCISIGSVLYCDLLEELISFLGQMSRNVSCARRRYYFGECACLSDYSVLLVEQLV